MSNTEETSAYARLKFWEEGWSNNYTLDANSWIAPGYDIFEKLQHDLRDAQSELATMRAHSLPTGESVTRGRLGSATETIQAYLSPEAVTEATDVLATEPAGSDLR